MAKEGFVAVPVALLRRQKALALDLVDVGVLVHLMSYWWSEGGDVFPSRETLAQRTGLDHRTVRRRLKRLQEHGLIKIIPGGGRLSNRYSFDGLVRLLDSSEAGGL